ncbi:hypothetical protein [Chitinophaga filiformis]|uniref:Uncharacterized protein n=1 Tax=Chitinophaga filiformis TaxID=104663 RepID=A0ABY4I3R3_CHIFI|nr:hypothetical protein [Chitinophaga filiformis]UPK70273.1 hypothetical protein MYF79_03075 [Chitinophaga filiformis]
MKRVLFILGATVFCLSCNQTRNRDEDTSGYEIITEKSYVVRNVKPVDRDPQVDSILQRRQELTAYLERHGFVRHVAGKDSLLFRRNNRQEVLIELPPPSNTQEANLIIAFDPMKNPLFINLKKDTTQVEQYIK